MIRDTPEFGARGLRASKRIREADNPLLVIGMHGVPLRCLPGVAGPGREHSKLRRARELGLEVVPESYLFARCGLDTSALAPKTDLGEVRAVTGIEDVGVVRAAAEAGLIRVEEEGHVGLPSLRVLQQFASLVNRGIGPSLLRRRLDGLREHLSIEDPLDLLARVELVGRDLLVRVGDRLIQPTTGQWWIGRARRERLDEDEDRSDPLAMSGSVGEGEAGDALFREAVAAQDAGRLEEAVDLYKRVLGLEPERASAHYNAGLLLSSLGHDDEAMSAFRAALVCAPHHSKAAYALGRLLRAGGQLGESEEVLTRAIAHSPGMIDAYAMRADVRDRLGDRSGAFRDWRTFVALAPQSSRVEYARERIAALSASAGPWPGVGGGSG